jgi:hypothetical protein
MTLQKKVIQELQEVSALREANCVCEFVLLLPQNTCVAYQEDNSYINMPSSQTFRSYLHNHYGPGIYSKFSKSEHVKIPEGGDNRLQKFVCSSKKNTTVSNIQKQ